METLAVVAVFGVMALVIVALVALSVHNQKKRTLAWRALAPTLDMTFAAQDKGLPDRYSGFKFFSTGHNRDASNVLMGRASTVGVTLCDYSYVTGSGKSSTYYQTTVCILDYPKLELPRFFLRPENFLDAIGELFGGQDFDFDEDPEFSKAFVLQGMEEAKVRKLFGPRTRQWFVHHRAESLRFEGAGSTLIVLSPRRVEHAQAQRLLDLAGDLVMLWGGGARR